MINTTLSIEKKLNFMTHPKSVKNDSYIFLEYKYVILLVQTDVLSC